MFQIRRVEIESLLYAFHDTVRKLKVLRLDILHGSSVPLREALGTPIQSSSISNPTENIAIELVMNTEIVRLHKNIKAISQTLSEAPEDCRIYVQQRYWNPPPPRYTSSDVRKWDNYLFERISSWIEVENS